MSLGQRWRGPLACWADRAWLRDQGKSGLAEKLLSSLPFPVARVSFGVMLSQQSDIVKPCLFKVNDASFFFGKENDLVRQTIHDFLHHDDLTTIGLCQVVIHGGSGCGKSAIVREIANAWSTRCDTAVVLTTGADFCRSLSEAIKTDDSLRLNHTFQDTPLLVLDDVQHLSGKSAAQEWLCQLLDYRVDTDRPTIVTSHKPVLQLQKLSSRLTGRLFAGLNIGIQFPDTATRRTLIHDAAAKAGLTLDSKEIQRLVEVTSGLTASSVIAMVLPQQSFDSTAATNAPSDDQVARLIIRVTAKKFGTKVRDIHGSSRRKSIVVPRAVAMYLIREYTRLSLVEVGQLFRRRDHTTVRHAYLKIQNQIAVDSVLRDAVTSIRETIGTQTTRPVWEAAS